MATLNSRDEVDAIPSTFTRHPLNISDKVTGGVRDRIAQHVDNSQRPTQHDDMGPVVRVPMTQSGGRKEFVDALLAEDHDFARPGVAISDKPTSTARNMLSQID